MKRRKRKQLHEQLRKDIEYSPNEIPEELERELVMNVKKHPWIFAMPGYKKQLELKHPELEKDINSIFAGQLALGRELKWENI